MADDERLREYVAASSSEEDFEAYLDKYVFQCGSHERYLERVGLSGIGSVGLCPRSGK